VISDNDDLGLFVLLYVCVARLHDHPRTVYCGLRDFDSSRIAARNSETPRQLALELHSGLKCHKAAVSSRQKISGTIVIAYDWVLPAYESPVLRAGGAGQFGRLDIAGQSRRGRAIIGTAGPSRSSGLE
jgi:hypothetical protein